MYYGLVHSGTPPIPSAAVMTNRAIVLRPVENGWPARFGDAGWLVVQDQAAARRHQRTGNLHEHLPAGAVGVFGAGRVAGTRPVARP